MPTTVTPGRLKEAAQAVLRTFGEGYVYAPGGRGTCSYVREDDPRYPKADGGDLAAEGATRSGCFIGEILSHLGLMTDRIAGSLLPISGLIWEGQIHEISDADPVGRRIRRAMDAAQYAQDNGESWGEAYQQMVELLGRE